MIISFAIIIINLKIIWKKALNLANLIKTKMFYIYKFFKIIMIVNRNFIVMVF